jgi:hypothetical protein
VHTSLCHQRARIVTDNTPMMNWNRHKGKVIGYLIYPIKECYGKRVRYSAMPLQLINSAHSMVAFL